MEKCTLPPDAPWGSCLVQRRILPCIIDHANAGIPLGKLPCVDTNRLLWQFV